MKARTSFFLSISFILALTPPAYAGGLIGKVVDEHGAPIPQAWLTTCNGRVATSDNNGVFAVSNLVDGAYALRVIALGREDALLPRIAVTSDAPVSCRLDLKRADRPNAIVSGCITDAATGKEIAAWLDILNNNKPIRWFDIDGRPYGGRSDVPPQTWHQKNKRYWTSGLFAFSARPGNLRICAHADGYAPVTVTRTLKPEKEEHLGLALHRLFDPADEGWFKGDFHAHGVHGEKLYTVNIPYMAFILRAEGYRWFYLSWDFSNDGISTDPFRIAQAENGPDLFLALNAEYPKTYGGHVGSVGIGPPVKPLPYPRYSNTETIKRDIVDQGGAAVPVHPLTGHMKSRELPFLMLGAPELVCGFDFYTGWSERLEKTWAMFLNRGYRLCRTATSDTAFDLGRTPGTMGATFIHPDSGQLTRETIVDAFKSGRTAISWKSALLTFTVDGACCGKVFPADGQTRKGNLILHHTPGADIQILVTRNGERFRQFSATVPATGQTEFDFPLNEREKAWYTALCFTKKPASGMIAAASPFYFGDWTPPAPVLAEVDAHVFDSETRQPLAATLTLLDPEKPDTAFLTKNGTLHLQARVFQRLKASAPGYAALETGLLNTPTVNAFIANVSEEDLQTWETYEKARDMLKTLVIHFPLKRE